MATNEQLSVFLKNKRVLITGNTGFKGSWLSLALHNFGAHVFGFSRGKTTDNEFGALVSNYIGIKQYYGDITNKELLEQAITNIKPDIIFHLAAQPLIIESYKNPFETINSNTFGTLCLLDVMKNYSGLCKLVIVTSGCYKAKNGKDIFDEDDELGGPDPYSISKYLQEQLIKTYQTNFFSLPTSSISCCTIRSGNVIGGGDFNESRLVPYIIKSILSKENIILRNSLSIRPWIHILDAINAYLLAAKGLFEITAISGQAFNVGSDKTQKHSVKDLVELFLKAYPSSNNTVIIEQNKDVFKEPDNLFLSNDKIKKALLWQNKITTEQIVNETVEWYKLYNKDKAKLIAFSKQQIADYFKA